MKKNKSHIISLLVLLIVLIIINILSNSFYKRFDLTQDHRYTLSRAALQTLDNIDSPLIIDVFLEGEFPSEFRRLKNETQQLLEEFELYNDFVKINFINPIEEDASRDNNIKILSERGLQPFQISIKESGKSSQEIIFPWALASYHDQTVKIPLLKNKIGATEQDMVTNSIQHLQFFCFFQ